MTLGPLGGLNPPPVNAPDAADLSPGIQPGIQNGLIIGNLVIIFGPSGAIGGYFQYQQGTTPGPGNQPIVSITNSSTDPFGNPTVGGAVVTYQTFGGNQMFASALGAGSIQFYYYNGTMFIAGPGMSISESGGGTSFGLTILAPGANSQVEISPVLWLPTQAADPGNANGVIVLFADPAGHLNYVSDNTAGDGNAYSTGRKTLLASATPQTINNTNPQVITGMTWPLAAGQTYRIEGVVTWTQGTGAVAQANGFAFSGTTTEVSISNEWVVATTFAQTTNFRRLTGLTTGTTPAFAAGAVVEWHFSGKIVVNAAGTLELVAAEGTSGDTYVINDGFADVLPAS